MEPIKLKNRSKLRLFLGSIFYFLKKQFFWLVNRQRLVVKSCSDLLPHVIFRHQTPLRRDLNDAHKLQENKIVNLRLAIQKINKIILEPSQLFSYWYLIGRPSRRKGYLPGMILKEGRVESGVGGGLCQLSNLIYWMTLHTPLKVTERWRHSYDVFPDSKRSQPFGSGATCAYPNIDLQILNQTAARFQLHLYLTETHLVGEWRSNQPLRVKYRVYEEEHLMRQELWGGYTRHNRIMRDTIDVATGRMLDTETVVENHAIMMYTPFLEGKH